MYREKQFLFIARENNINKNLNIHAVNTVCFDVNQILQPATGTWTYGVLPVSLTFFVFLGPFSSFLCVYHTIKKIKNFFFVFFSQNKEHIFVN